MGRACLLLLVLVVLATCKGTKKNKDNLCPEYRSAICPYGVRHVMDTKRGCRIQVCTEIRQPPAKPKGGDR